MNPVAAPVSRVAAAREVVAGTRQPATSRGRSRRTCPRSGCPRRRSPRLRRTGSRPGPRRSWCARCGRRGRGRCTSSAVTRSSSCSPAPSSTGQPSPTMRDRCVTSVVRPARARCRRDHDPVAIGGLPQRRRRWSRPARPGDTTMVCCGRAVRGPRPRSTQRAWRCGDRSRLPSAPRCRGQHLRPVEQLATERRAQAVAAAAARARRALLPIGVWSASLRTKDSVAACASACRGADSRATQAECTASGPTVAGREEGEQGTRRRRRRDLAGPGHQLRGEARVGDRSCGSARSGRCRRRSVSGRRGTRSATASASDADARGHAAQSPGSRRLTRARVRAACGPPATRRPR